MDELKAMQIEEIESFLNEAQQGLKAIKTNDRLFELYMELTIIRSEMHHLAHFCVDDYERKQLFSLIDRASAIQVLTEKQIDDHFQSRSDNLKYDFEVEKRYMQQTLQTHMNEAILFREFSEKLLSNEQYSRIKSLSLHCRQLNMKVSDYIKKNGLPKTEPEYEKRTVIAAERGNPQGK